MGIIKNKKLSLFLIVTLFLLLGGASTWYLYNKNSKKNSTTDGAQTTSTEPSAQANFSDGSNENKGEAANSLRENKGSATVSDQGGSGAAETSNPIVSQDGNITLYSPTKGAVIKSGTSFSGSSKVSLISYRIIDSTSGVIASGELKVIDGKFSGTITFNTSAPEGRLDFYATRADGTEFSNIEVPIKLQQ